MRAISTALIVLVILLSNQRAHAQNQSTFEDGWRFTKGDPAEVKGAVDYAQVGAKQFGFAEPKFDDANWRTVNLPHDWAIEGPYKLEYPGETGRLPYWGIGWYRKHFNISGDDAGKKICLDIDGAMSHSAVWLNGQYVGGWPYGYASYRLDLTPAIKAGAENVLAIRLDNPAESSRWYPGAGIYRHIRLVMKNPVHVDHWGTYVTTPKVSRDAATVHIRTDVVNDSGKEIAAVVNTEIFDSGNKIAAAEPMNVTIAKTSRCEQEIPIDHPKLWDLKSPHRYMAVTTIEQDGKIVDRYETPFGIRTIRFDADKGFLLNDQHVPLNGVCDHHDLGALGSALNHRALQRQIEILKEMGCNAIRTSHNPPAPELLELCDEMGLVVMDEAFDVWETAKKKNDYHLDFPAWHDRDLRALIHRDRNHPCVILWSIGNEIREQADPAKHHIGAELTNIAHEEDPTRPTTSGCNNANSWNNGFYAIIDVFGDNYDHNNYAKFHKAHPEQPVFGSETASCISSRGEYYFPVVEDKSQGKGPFQMSSYDLYAPRWAWPPDHEFKELDQNPFAAGEFVWTGFDYMGEPTPFNADLTNALNFTDPAERARAEKELKELGKVRSPSRSSYFGIVDLCGFKKDRFYLYQSRWRSELPMAHILPHWNWPDRVGEVTPVHVYTSGDSAELFLNGKSLGKKTKGQYEYRLRWDDVKYEPGEVKVVAYRDGKEWATDVVKTTGPAAEISLTQDRAKIGNDGQDLSYITVKIEDKDGLMVPRSKNRISFEIAGPGEIVATDNGDATDLEVFASHERKAFNGMALVIVRGKVGQSGNVTVTAKSPGLQPATVAIETSGMR